MHPNPTFHSADHAKDLALVRARAFGTLAVNGAEWPETAHVPFLLSDNGQTIDLHLVRSNPIARLLKDPRPARLTVLGPDGYISPDWYGIDDQVPTWNYVAVRLSGRLELLPQDDLPGLLDRQSDAFEARLLPKPIWRMSKVSDDVMTRFLRMIVPCRFHIAQVEATWKLGQNKLDAVRLMAADHVAQSAFGADMAELAKLMQEPPEL
ncbi:Protease synthase and sporulation protein PAI 2 [Pseudoprimorskyibacter insulae]|uniref:Protease synthase and sporulation protein PAI 2 n=2 Tax=Pseudoprimorskyibacter insulae TaxID=1695997 RepID=A0A2R8AV04_9RHOB|nr:FMN-binding negative transcriptional regulator [Pseudoprimorskyibacter insulae]SPF79757.1 Protease synthase and sporulation protein PAI 2 [Pseudoprimorskyibacter insulae]